MRFLTSLFIAMIALSSSPIHAIGSVSRSSLSTSESISSIQQQQQHASHQLEFTPGGGITQISVPSSYYESSRIPSGTTYVSFVGEKGEIQEQKGRMSKVQVIDVRHEITSPRDASTGLPTGKRQHAPFRLVIPQGESTPQLYQAFVSGEILKSVTVGTYEPTKTTPKETLDGKQTLISTTTLSSVSIGDIQQQGNNILLSLYYKEIKWRYTTGGVEASDSWEAQK